jgi:hypothetical protein
MIFTGEILSVLLEIGIHLSLWNPKLTVIGFTENHETRSVLVQNSIFEIWGKNHEPNAFSGLSIGFPVYCSIFWFII